MTEKNGKFYCDICKDKEPIAKGTGFSFDVAMFPEIKHTHQSCYKTVYEIGKRYVNHK